MTSELVVGETKLTHSQVKLRVDFLEHLEQPKGAVKTVSATKATT